MTDIDCEIASLFDRIRAIVHSPEAETFRDEALRHVVAQPYADNRYVRLLDDIRAVLSTADSRIGRQP